MDPTSKPPLEGYYPLGTEAPVDPNDKRLVVPRRLGTGWRLNYNRPMAWVLTTVMLAAVLLLVVKPPAVSAFMPYIRIAIFIGCAYLFVLGLRGTDHST